MNINYTIVKNEMPASSSEAKYLGKVIPNGVVNLSQLVDNALEYEHFAESTFNAVIETAIALTQELCASGHDVDWGPFKFAAKIHGSMPYEDSAFEDGTSSLTIDADATNSTREALATLTPVKISAADAGQLIRVSNEMDIESEEFQTIYGSKQFMILGNGITLDAEGEYVKAINRKTGVAAGTAQVISVSKGQRGTCKFSPQLAAGDYQLEIATKGLAEEDTPRVFTKNVTAYHIDEPTLSKVTAEGQSGIIKGQPIVAVGTHLGTGTYKAKWTQGGTAHEAALTATEVTSTQLKFAALADLASVDDNTEITVEVTINGATASKSSPLYPCVPLAESADGKVRVYTLTPATGSELVVGETQNMRGNWLGWDEATQTGVWKKTETFADETVYLNSLNAAELSSNLRVASAGSEPLIGIDPGTHQVVTTLYRKENGVEVDPLSFTISMVVREA